jgi:hypothetical protein
MPKVKIFVKELEHLEVLEAYINKFIEDVELIDVKTSIGKNKFGEELFIACVIYEDYEEDVEIEEDGEDIEG